MAENTATVPETGKRIGFDEHGVDPNYRAALKNMNETGTCNFCPEHIHKLKNPPIEPERWTHWWIKENDFPYKHHRKHFVLILKRHETDFAKITPEEWAEIKPIIDWANATYSIEGGGFVFRYGPEHKSGATMAHAHCHIQEPDGTGYAIAVFHWTNPQRDWLKANNWNLFPQLTPTPSPQQ